MYGSMIQSTLLESNFVAPQDCLIKFTVHLYSRQASSRKHTMSMEPPLVHRFVYCFRASQF